MPLSIVDPNSSRRRSSIEQVVDGAKNGLHRLSAELHDAEDLEPKPGSDDFDAAWEYHEVKGGYFGTVKIAPDGGFSDVSALFGPMRFLFAIITLVFVGMNVQSIFTRFLVIMPHIMDDWVVTRPGDNPLVFVAIMDWLGFDHHPGPAVVVSLFEFGLVVLLLARVVGALVIAVVSGGVMKENVRWRCLAFLFWDVVPELAVVSAMKLLYFVTPSIFVAGLVAEIQGSITRGGTKYGVPVVWYFSTRVLAGAIGLDAFIVRFSITSTALERGEGLIPAVIFLNQALGVVQLSWFVQTRLFTFIFGGEDGVMEDHEVATMTVWKAMLTREIWRQAPGTLSFLAVLLSFGDADFQQLALAEANVKAPDEKEGLELASFKR